MRQLAFQAIRNIVVGGAVILTLAPLIPICSFIYFFSPSAPALGDR